MKRVLIIEDDVKISSLERDYLEANGFEVTVENNGLSGLKTALAGDFNLIVLDIMLPDMEGYDVLRNVRSEKDIPIIFVTAKNEDIDKIRGLGLGADDFITKPFSPAELVARVKAHINRYERLVKTDTSNVIEVGALYIDVPARRVFLSGKEVTLANKEFDLLVFLAKNPNVVYTKETLFNKIWGEESIGELSTVTVHINRIREKIEKDMSNPVFIETVWGAGYRFKG